jgi:Protein of unknown function (DUF3037)
MEDRLVYEYAIIRVVPRVEREEFINVGVVVFCKVLDFIEVIIDVPKARLSKCIDEELLVEIQNHLRSFENIARGTESASPIAALSVAERFRWLTATRSTMVQCSRIHSGLCHEAEGLAAHLMAQMVY